MMSESNNSQPILNPNVYLNYLSPTTASGYEITRDVFLITLGALLWDILSSLPDDCRMIRTTKFSPVLFAYLSSRICALTVALMSVLTKTGPIQNCGLVELILCIFWVIASGSASYLFLKRVHAVFPDQKFVRHTFTVLWVIGVGASTVVLPGPLYDYHEIANTKHCINVKIKSYVSTAFIVPMFFDAFVYFAISYKILMFHRPSKPASWRAFCRGGALPHLSQAVFQGGQQYYMITTGVSITRTVVALLPSIPPTLQLLPSVPAVALTCVMACRVYRNLKLEALRETEVENLTTIRFADRGRVNVHLPKNIQASFTENGSEQY